MSHNLDAHPLNVWRMVAIALMADLADAGADPLSPAVIAYNHARNGRWDEAFEAAGWVTR
jgi:hypothetical protein